jgi:HTH-type transcriptional regulator/antitoxin HigA
MQMENMRPIKNEVDYDMALDAIDRLICAAPDTPESDELEVLVTLVEAYEAKHWPIEAPDPISALEHVMEARGLRPRLRRADRVSEHDNEPGPRRSCAGAVGH